MANGNPSPTIWSDALTCLDKDMKLLDTFIAATEKALKPGVSEADCVPWPLYAEGLDQSLMLMRRLRLTGELLQEAVRREIAIPLHSRS